MSPTRVVGKSAYAGLFMVTLATLMYETLLTRIFSVTMWYHFAFVAISIAMFGMTVGAIIVYLFPARFTEERAKDALALSALLFSLSVVVSFMAHLSIPFRPGSSILGVFWIGLTYVVLSVPFVLSGICVSVALTRFPKQISKLYAADLAGAAIGCVAIIHALKLSDGPTAVVIVATLAGLGAALFAIGAGRAKMVMAALLATAVLASLAVINTAQVNRGEPLMRLKWVKGGVEGLPVYEKWNSFSRIRVWGNQNSPTRAFGWGLSPALHRPTVRQLWLNIDANAATVLTGYSGDPRSVDYLKYDIVNLAHQIRPNSHVLVIGSGGGRDVLSALAFRQRSVTGVEMNEDIIKAVNRRFGEFTGHLDKLAGVTFVHDEARSYVSRQKRKFDIIQVSLIDTWAATAAGAFVLAEQSLYTTEAWKTFLEHLTPGGVLTFSRWYYRDRPGEMYRLTSLARAALDRAGIKNPRDHIVIVRSMAPGSPKDVPEGVGTMLISNQPFSSHDLEALEDTAKKLRFEVVLSPRQSIEPAFAEIASTRDPRAYDAAFPLNIAAPTDDSPFFFHMLRLRDVFRPELRQQGIVSFNMKAVYVLGVLLIVVTVLTFLCIVVPLILTAKRSELRGAWPLIAFFAAIGLGFMLVEISQMQRLIVFLGHPTYGLSVVLFSLLLSSSLGSYLTQKAGDADLRGAGRTRLLLLLGALILFGLLTPHAIAVFRGSDTPTRILVATGILCCLGLFMGMAFPLGMRLAASKSASLTAWLWGINGATSVCASVLAVAIALSSGIHTSFWTGCACYGAAFLAFMRASGQRT